MASIRKHGNAYQIRVFVGTDQNGKRLTKYFTYKPTAKSEKAQEKEVLQYAYSLEKRIKRGEEASGESITFRKFYEEYWRPDAKNSLTPRGFEIYDNDLKNHVLETIGAQKIGRIYPLTLKALVKSWETQGLSASTIKKIFTATRSVFEQAYTMSIIETDPCERVKLPKVTRDPSAIHFFTPEQANKFFDVLKNGVSVHVGTRHRLTRDGQQYDVAGYDQRVTYSKMWYAFFVLLVYSSVRRSEAQGLKWYNVDFARKTITIEEALSHTKELGQFLKDTKTPSSVRELICPEIVFDTLKIWKKEQQKKAAALGTAWHGPAARRYDENFVFTSDIGEAMNLCTSTHKFRDICDTYNKEIEYEAAILEKQNRHIEAEGKLDEKLPRITMHDLRHTGPTLMIGNNVDIATVSHRMGHSKISTTLDIYTSVIPAKDQVASDALEKILDTEAAVKPAKIPSEDTAVIVDKSLKS